VDEPQRLHRNSISTMFLPSLNMVIQRRGARRLVVPSPPYSSYSLFLLLPFPVCVFFFGGGRVEGALNRFPFFFFSYLFALVFFLSLQYKLVE
jgi:hypothetical protein